MCRSEAWAFEDYKRAKVNAAAAAQGSWKVKGENQIKIVYII